MINEYLFLSSNNRSSVEAYKPDSASVEISNIEKTPLWVATYSVPNNNEDSAKKLSDIHNEIMPYEPLVLTCESSEYFNRIIYPLINEFERKLRKLLYLSASISDNVKAKESFDKLEDKDLGVIFDLLFIDQNFIVNMKKRINADAKSEFNGRSNYSKVEIKGYLDSLTEHTFWDAIIGENYVPTLRRRFREVHKYRNNVMHAHNIGKLEFGKAQYLFNKINKELNSAIGERFSISEENVTEKRPEVNTAISSAIEALDLSEFSEVLRKLSLSTALPDMSSQVWITLDELKFLSSLATEKIRNQLSEAMRPYQQLLDSLKLNSALQESLPFMTEGLSNILNIENDPDETDKDETKNDSDGENPEENTPNE